MKLRRIPIENPIGLGIVAGAIILASFPKVRKIMREYVVKGVSSTIGLTNKFYEKNDQEKSYEKSYDFSKPLNKDAKKEDSMKATQDVEEPISENVQESLSIDGEKETEEKDNEVNSCD
jgi:hypothetical protein